MVEYWSGSASKWISIGFDFVEWEQDLLKEACSIEDAFSDKDSQELDYHFLGHGESGSTWRGVYLGSTGLDGRDGASFHGRDGASFCGRDGRCGFRSLLIYSSLGI